MSRFVAGFQRDLEPAAVQRRVGAVGADEGGDVLDVRILQQLRHQRLLALGHGGDEMDWEASVTPWMSPVSCTGKKPLGMTT